MRPQGGVILVRHAMPEVVPGVSSTLWQLGERSLEDCVLLAHALPAPLAPVVLRSPQPKVRQTAAVLALRLGLDFAGDARLREVEQGAGRVDDYRSLAAGYLERGAVGEAAGWEPPGQVITRFGEAVKAALEHNQGVPGDVLVVTHGLAMSLWLAAQSKIDPVPFWKALTFPDAWRLDTQTGELQHLWRGGQAPD
jgi:broad specificity phosphatase PhoE